VGLSSPYHSSFAGTDELATLGHYSSSAAVFDAALSCQDHSSSFAVVDDFSHVNRSSPVELAVDF